MPKSTSDPLSRTLRPRLVTTSGRRERRQGSRAAAVGTPPFSRSKESVAEGAGSIKIRSDGV